MSFFNNDDDDYERTAASSFLLPLCSTLLSLLSRILPVVLVYWLIVKAIHVLIKKLFANKFPQLKLDGRSR